MQNMEVQELSEEIESYIVDIVILNYIKITLFAFIAGLIGTFILTLLYIR